jgi:L-asparaginase
VGLVIEGRALFQLDPRRTPPLEGEWSNEERPVALLKIGLGDDGRLIKALPSRGFAGAVIEGMGAGHVPAHIAPLLGTIAEQMPLVLASRVDTGPSFTQTYAFPGSEVDLLGRGLISAGSLSGLKARLLLSLLLRTGHNRMQIRATFEMT